MAIDLPNLDDRRFTDLVEEGRRLIPGFAPSWTDHNASDPGITLVELFAWYTEMLLYRVDRVSEANKWAFARLLAPDHRPTPGLTVDQELSVVINDLRVEPRAVTAADFERLALQVPGVSRARCLPRRNLESGGANASTTEALGHTTLVVDGRGPSPDALATAVKNHLAGRSLITTTVHVVTPVRLPIAVHLTLRIRADELASSVETRALDALARYFDPISGGADGQGWPFGAPVYRSGVYSLLDQVPGVDYVEVVPANDDLFVVGAPADNRKLVSGQGYVGLRLLPHELVTFSPGTSTLDCVAVDTRLPG